MPKKPSLSKQAALRLLGRALEAVQWWCAHCKKPVSTVLALVVLRNVKNAIKCKLRSHGISIQRDSWSYEGAEKLRMGPKIGDQWWVGGVGGHGGVWERTGFEWTEDLILFNEGISSHVFVHRCFFLCLLFLTKWMLFFFFGGGVRHSKRNVK